jgi:hypothetical protein
MNQFLNFSAGVRLDINLEKSRIHVEAVDLKAQLKEAEDRIDEQMDKLQNRMNSIKESTKKGSQRFVLVLISLLLSYRIVVYLQS